MNRLLCRIAEYYLALCEDKISDLPAWVERHLQGCPRCQAIKTAYVRTREATRRYAQMLPDSPPMGWRPLPFKAETKPRALPLPFILAPAAAVVVALAVFVLWERGTPPVGEGSRPPQLAQGVTAPQPKMPQQSKPRELPVLSTKDISQLKLSQRAPTSGQIKSAPVPSQTPAAPVRQLRRPPHILIAAQPAPHTASPVEPEPGVQTSSEPAVPVQPVLVEAHPPSSPVQIPEAYVMQAAYPASAGGVE
jgi:hypothetical protein